MSKETNSSLVAIHEEVTKELANKEVMNSLIATTFKGLNESSVKQAIVEGMMRGFKFKDFLEKNIYAIPFKGGYSLITSIDYARKIGMRSGIVGKEAPSFEIGEDKKVISCTVTVKKKFDNYVGDFTATVYFDEYYKEGRTYNGTYYPSLWDSKPKTMIAKVAEMHALRMACPEELSEAYVEEEMEKEAEIKKPAGISEEDLAKYEITLNKAKDLEELKVVWANMPFEAKEKLGAIKDEVKLKLTPKKDEDNTIQQ